MEDTKPPEESMDTSENDAVENSGVAAAARTETVLGIFWNIDACRIPTHEDSLTCESVIYRIMRSISEADSSHPIRSWRRFSIVNSLAAMPNAQHGRLRRQSFGSTTPIRVGLPGGSFGDVEFLQAGIAARTVDEKILERSDEFVSQHSTEHNRMHLVFVGVCRKRLAPKVQSYRRKMARAHKNHDLNLCTAAQMHICVIEKPNVATDAWPLADRQIDWEKIIHDQEPTEAEITKL